MKKTILGTAMVSILFLFSCQKENSQEENSVMSKSEKENWLTANLDAEFANSQKQVTAYLFSKDELKTLVNTPNVTEVRFILGYADNTIQINIAGVDKTGKKLGTVTAAILKEPQYDTKLVELNELSVSTTSKRSLLLNSHLLSNKDAFEGIKAWQEKLSTVSDLDEITSYEGLRFRHFNLESAVIEAMVSKENTANVGLFLGLNEKGKLTTILIGLDKNNEVKKTSATSKTAEELYDFTQPSPPATGDDD